MPKNKVHKLKDGRYTYSVVVAREPKKINSWQNETLKEFKVRCDALDKLAEVSEKDKSGLRAMTLDDLFWLWIEDYVNLQLSKSDQENTPDTYQRYVKPYLGNRLLTDIAPADVYMVLSRADKRSNLSKSSIDKIRGCISRPYNWAIRTLGARLPNPTQGVQYKVSDRRQEPHRRVMTVDEYTRILSAAEGTKYYGYYQLLYLTGLRPSEGAGLKLTDFDDEYIYVSRAMTTRGLSGLKTPKAERKIPLTPPIKKVVSAQLATLPYLTTEQWLFPAEQGIPSLSAISQAFKRTLKQTGEYEYGGKTNRKKLAVIKPPLNFRLYDFRHTFATRMAEAGMPEKALMEIMGHEDIAVTLEYYIGITDKMRDIARELMS